MPKFSIILATRDRPRLFEAALRSVLDQDFDDFELVVVNDGSTDENAAAYRSILQTAQDGHATRIDSHWLVRRPKGHGQSYSLNFGVASARGDYVGFLDDDDCWTDTGHLSRAAGVIDAQTALGREPDLYMGNQTAFVREAALPGPVWLEGLEGLLRSAGRRPFDDGSFAVSVDDLLRCGGFAHLNCLIARRELYEKIGGMDEGIRWECDRDLFLRLIDDSALMLHHPARVARHNVPDPKLAASMTTTLSMVEKRLLQVRVLDKAALFASSPAIRRHGWQHKGYALKKIAQQLADSGDWRSAAAYASEALGVAPTLKWLGYTAYCWFKRVTGRTADTDDRRSDSGNSPSQ